LTDHRSPPPPAEGCLCQPYPSSQKGGTIIAESVVSFEEHERLLRNGGYRPTGCLRCGQCVHIHDFRVRVLAGHPREVTEVAVFRCADRDRCGAVIRVLPALLARRLWRCWSTVERAVASTLDGGEERIAARAVPPRTVRRWQARLLSSAATLVVVLGTAGEAVPSLRAVSTATGLGATRAELVTQYGERGEPAPRRGHRLEAVAAVIHRLEPGVRLM
jgi:hypothetical protein